MRIFLSIQLLLWFGCPAFAQQDKPATEKKEQVVFPPTSNGWTLVSTIRHAPLKESSGFAVSAVHRGMLWTHNDGGAGSNLFALDISSGSLSATINIPSVPNLDWEDAMSITLAGKSMIAIADIGDNEKRRTDCVIHLFEEGSSDATGSPELSLVRSIRFRYPDGKRYDAESAAFDSRNNRLLVLTKSKTETLLFEIAIPAANQTVDADAILVASLAKPLTYPETSALVSLKRGIFRGSATAADISPDGSLLAVLTYTECLLYRRGADETDWKAAALRHPQVLPLPGIYQAESLCFSRDGSELLVTSENSPSPLYKIPVPSREP